MYKSIAWCVFPGVFQTEDDGIDVTKTPSTFLTTEFTAWCSRVYAVGKSSRRSFLKQSDAQADPESEVYYKKEIRYRRNAQVRQDSVLERQKAEAGPSRLDDQIFINKNPKTPSVVKFHPFHPYLLVADKDSFSTWDLDAGAKISSVSNAHSMTSGITALEILNAHEGTGAYVLVGSEDGAVRVWRDFVGQQGGVGPVVGSSRLSPSLENLTIEADEDVEISRVLKRNVSDFDKTRQPKLVTAWQVFNELLPSTRSE